MIIEFKQKYLIGIVLGLVLLIYDIARLNDSFLFWPLIVLSFTLGWSQFWLDFFVENQRQKELEIKFPEFVRNLVGAIKSGMPVSRAILYVSDTDYGSLTPYIKKLANQIEWAIPIHKALTRFADSTNNIIIKRAIATVIEAEKAGGNMEDVLMSITESLIEIKKIKLSRRTAIYSQTIQSYVIFFVFLGIMVIIQNVLVPYISTFSQSSDSIVDTSAMFGINEKVQIVFSSPSLFFSSLGRWFVSFHGILLMLSMFQGFFAGLVMGKLAEGELKFGVKHSLILVTISFFVITLAQGFIK